MKGKTVIDLAPPKESFYHPVAFSGIGVPNNEHWRWNNFWDRPLVQPFLTWYFRRSLTCNLKYYYARYICIK